MSIATKPAPSYAPGMKKVGIYIMLAAVGVILATLATCWFDPYRPMDFSIYTISSNLIYGICSPVVFLNAMALSGAGVSAGGAIFISLVQAGAFYFPIIVYKGFFG